MRFPHCSSSASLYRSRYCESTFRIQVYCCFTKKHLLPHLIIRIYHNFPHLCTIVAQRHNVKEVKVIRTRNRDLTTTQLWQS